MIQVFRAKLHNITVTGADLHYHGSVTLDPEFCEDVGIFPLEFVYIWNKATGARFSTYVIYGERGSKSCILNGAASRLVAPGDQVIISAEQSLISPQELHGYQAKVAILDKNNHICDRLSYVLGTDSQGRLDFKISPRSA